MLVADKATTSLRGDSRKVRRVSDLRLAHLRGQRSRIGSTFMRGNRRCLAARRSAPELPSTRLTSERSPPSMPRRRKSDGPSPQSTTTTLRTHSTLPSLPPEPRWMQSVTPELSPSARLSMMSECDENISVNQQTFPQLLKICLLWLTPDSIGGKAMIKISLYKIILSYCYSYD